MKLKYDFALQQIGNFWGAVPTGSDALKYNAVLSLNETARDMMEMLREDTTEETMVNRLAEDYDISIEQLREDVHNFVQKLQEARILI